jgi:hypothetical protein
MVAILIFMAALALFVVALEIDSRRRPRLEEMVEQDDDSRWELTHKRFSRDQDCACDPLDEQPLQ